MKKKLIIVLLILLAGLAFSIFKSCTRAKPKHHLQSSTTEQIVTSSPSSSTASSSLPEAQKEAEDSLEEPNNPLSEEEKEPIKEALTIAFDYLNKQPQDLVGTVDNRLSVTPQAMLQTIVTMLKANYQVDFTSLKGYHSDSDNVYQFTINLTKESSEPLTLTGNYVTGTQQCDIEALHGIPTGIQ